MNLALDQLAWRDETRIGTAKGMRCANFEHSQRLLKALKCCILGRAEKRAMMPKLRCSGYALGLTRNITALVGGFAMDIRTWLEERAIEFFHGKLADDADDLVSIDMRALR